MIVFIFILAASSLGVESQRCVQPAYQQCPGPCNPTTVPRNPYETPPIAPCDFYMPNLATTMPVAVTPDTVYLQPRIMQEIAVPVATVLETTVPVIPFITEFSNCPDICFKDILASPLGCLDPILTIYGVKDVCPLPDLPVRPLLSTASSISALASPFSKLLPPVCDCECYSHYLRKVPIPPPFI